MYSPHHIVHDIERKLAHARASELLYNPFLLRRLNGTIWLGIKVDSIWGAHNIDQAIGTHDGKKEEQRKNDNERVEMGSVANKMVKTRKLRLKRTQTLTYRLK
jgi:hypothetical protein